MCPMCPRDFFTICLQPLTRSRFPKPGLSTRPNPRTSAVGFHPLHKIPSPKILTLTMIYFTRFSQNNFPKNFSGTCNERPVRDFPKVPHRTFRSTPASNYNLIQPTPKPERENSPSFHIHPTSATFEFIAEMCASVIASSSPSALNKKMGTPGTSTRFSGKSS